MKRFLALLLALALLSGCAAPVQTNDPGGTPQLQQSEQLTSSEPDEPAETPASTPEETDESDESGTIPAYSGEPYCVVNGNVPNFSESDYTTEPFETFSELDALGRCGAAYANVCIELMPTEERGSIGQVKPSGWQTVRYDIVDGQYLYNRCHLLGFQLTGENANERNLITGTRYLNVDGMLPFENLIADYVKETENHVLYRVTPCYTGDNLVADGVLMEAWSVEDGGEGVCFSVYCYNVQPGITIDYATGESALAEEGGAEQGSDETEASYVLNTNSKKFHSPGCSGAANIKQENRQDFTGLRSDLLALGYEPCGLCKP